MRQIIINVQENNLAQSIFELMFSKIIKEVGGRDVESDPEKLVINIISRSEGVIGQINAAVVNAAVASTDQLYNTIVSSNMRGTRRLFQTPSINDLITGEGHMQEDHNA